jgi:hypothetical protein
MRMNQAFLQKCLDMQHMNAAHQIDAQHLFDAHLKMRMNQAFLQKCLDMQHMNAA